MCLQYSHYNFILCFLSLQVFNRYFTNSRRSSKDVFLPYIPFYLLYLLNTSFHHHPYKSSLIYQWSIPVLRRTLLQLLLWALNVLRNITVKNHTSSCGILPPTTSLGLLLLHTSWLLLYFLLYQFNNLVSISFLNLLIREAVLVCGSTLQGGHLQKASISY